MNRPHASRGETSNFTRTWPGSAKPHPTLRPQTRPMGTISSRAILASSCGPFARDFRHATHYTSSLQPQQSLSSAECSTSQQKQWPRGDSNKSRMVKRFFQRYSKVSRNHHGPPRMPKKVMSHGAIKILGGFTILQFPPPVANLSPSTRAPWHPSF